MNLQLQNPFAGDLPEVIETYLADGHGTTVSFNGRGSLLAVGCLDGRVCIWDFDTRSVARIFLGHVHPVTSVSWSKNGKKLLSSSTDWHVIIWDVLTGAELFKKRFDSPVLSAQLHPRHPVFICSPLLQPPVLYDYANDRFTLLTRSPSNSLSSSSSDDDDDDDDDNVQGKGKKSLKNGGADPTTLFSIASFSRKGRYIYCGNADGCVLVLEHGDGKSSAGRRSLLSLRVAGKLKMPGGAAIKSMSFSRNGKYLVVNSADKCVRLFDIEAGPRDRENFGKLLREFRELVSQMQWRRATFSSDSDFVIGGSAEKAEHNIYIWNQLGQLKMILEGPKEGIVDLAWHPNRPIIASCSTTGIVYIWSTNRTESWSAFAPGFKELEENEYYVEREGEFDVEDEDCSDYELDIDASSSSSSSSSSGVVANDDSLRSSKRQRTSTSIVNAEELSVDIVTVEKFRTFDSDSDSSDSDDELWFLPTIPIPDDESLRSLVSRKSIRSS
jgi:COMPASS component SWD1